MATPPEKKSASTTRMRRPSRTSRVLTSIGANLGRRNMSTVSRAGTKSSPPWRCSITNASSPMMTRPCSDFGVPRAVRDGGGNEGVLVLGEERLAGHGARPCRILRDEIKGGAMQRRAATPPSRFHRAPQASRSMPARRTAPAQGIAHSAHTAAPRTSGLASSSNRSASSAKAASLELPIAISTLRTKRSRPMRLTGDFENSARNAASSSRASSASRGARNSSRAASFVSRPVCANLFHGQTARQSSQP